MPSPETAQARERVRLAAGALTWQLASDYTGRVWEVCCTVANFSLCVIVISFGFRFAEHTPR